MLQMSIVCLQVIHILKILARLKKQSSNLGLKIKVRCMCEENFGGADCSLDLSSTAALTLNRKCCDLRNENCEEIHGFGFPFSTRDKIYAQIQLVEVFKFNSLLIF